MGKIRRYYFPNAIVFITSVTSHREKLFFKQENADLFWITLEKVKSLYPFELMAYVLLPDHFHWLIKLPENTFDFSKILSSFKGNFTFAYKEIHHILTPLHLWQKRFWDHIIRDENDLKVHLDYIHWNPVKHGLVDEPEKWGQTSFLDWVNQGIYDAGWGNNEEPESICRISFE